MPPLPSPGLRPWLRQRLRAVLGRALAAHPAHAAAALVPAAATATAASQALDARCTALDRRLDAAAATLRLRSAPFSADMTIAQALARHPGTAGVLAAHHLPGCGGCAVRFDETLAEAAEAYGLDLEGLLAALAALLAR